MKSPKEKNKTETFKVKTETETKVIRSPGNQPEGGGDREDGRCQLPSGTIHPYRESGGGEVREGGHGIRLTGEINKKERKEERRVDREGDGSYLSSSAVQLECRESEGVTEKLMKG